MSSILSILLGLSLFSANQREINKLNPMTIEPNYEIATLGGGCFWCSQAVFKDLKGVVSIEAGYSGGDVKNPSYREVCSGNTGHAEVVQIRFDPSIISFKEILDVFFHSHNPTTLNQQGADVGSQYRSVIFYHNATQKSEAEEVIKTLSKSGEFHNPIITQLVEFTAFYKAEEYHQDYFAKNPDAAYCTNVIRPKVDKVRKNYSEKLK
jgi:peptide-methionine (S)-S-oxide reductase